MASLNEAVNLLLELYMAGRLAEGAALAGRILDAVPDHAGARQIAGAIEAARGRHGQAAAIFRAALAYHPDLGSGWSNLANVLRAAGGAASGESAALRVANSAYCRALVLDPTAADPWINRAGLLKGMGQAAAAVESCRRGLALAPSHAAAAVNLADAALGIPAIQPAVLWSRRAVALDPLSGPARLNLAAALAAAGQYHEAAAAARTAVTRHPRPALALETLGGILARLGDEAGAAAALADCAAAGGTPTLRRTRMSAHLSLARPRDALVDIDALLRDHPGDVGLQWNRAIALLQAGDWAAGWPAFEWRRLDDRALPPWRDLGVPAWDGALLAGRTILLYAEQGWGDVLQMLRFVPLVAARGGRVILEVMAALVPLVRRVTAALPGVAAVVARGAPLPPFTVECPLMSLPGLFGATPLQVPGTVPYLTADQARVAHWQPALAALGAGLKVGVVWAGNGRFADDARRSPGLAALAPLFTVPGVRFVGLQMGDGREQLAGLALPDSFADFGARIADPDDTAAIMAGLDLVISSCTMPAHLAGGLGRPLWLMLAHAPDWRWLLGREDTPWYPTATLFRQPVPGDWGAVVGQMCRRLAVLAK